MRHWQIGSSVGGAAASAALILRANSALTCPGVTAVPHPVISSGGDFFRDWGAGVMASARMVGSQKVVSECIIVRSFLLFTGFITEARVEGAAVTAPARPRSRS